MSSRPWLRRPASEKPLLLKVGRKRLRGNELGSKPRADLRGWYLRNLSDFQSYHLVYVDGFGRDKRVGFRWTGRSSLGVAPAQVAQFHRDQRYQILPVCGQDGIVLSRIFRGSTDATVFEDFIAQLLQHSGRWPEPKSVLVMGNASFHHSERIAPMCRCGGEVGSSAALFAGRKSDRRDLCRAQKLH